jgi:hypothetical protein
VLEGVERRTLSHHPFQSLQAAGEECKLPDDLTYTTVQTEQGIYIGNFRPPLSNEIQKLHVESGSLGLSERPAPA